jgi:hypothetical protein
MAGAGDCRGRAVCMDGASLRVGIFYSKIARFTQALKKRAIFTYENWLSEFKCLGATMKKQIARIGVMLAVPMLSGCGMCRSIEQWKCDNWGMCHFAPNRPGVYAPMSVQPTYGAPASYGASVAPPAGAIAPATMVPMVGTPVPSGMTIGNPVNPGCKDCNR